MSVLWTRDQAVAATGGTCDADFNVTGVSIDTRTIQPGDLFVALSAARDGHDFVAQALENGAGAALVTHRPEGVDAGSPLLIVPDVLSALEDLGRAARARTAAKVVAITGSVGKTSAKEMARAALGGQGKVHAAEASYNNHWGVPLTLARMPQDSDFAVIEIGMSAAGEISPLARMARPDVSLITTIAPAHLEAFESLDGIAAEKATIMDGQSAEDGVAILNGDVPSLPVQTGYADRLGVPYQLFGFGADVTWTVLETIPTQDSQAVTADGPNGGFSFEIQAPGSHHAQNALGVLAACAGLGADFDSCLRSIATWLPPEGRGQREVLTPPGGGTFLLIDDAFNANPASMGASLEVFALIDPDARHVAILGDMLELGPDEAAMHAGIADLPAVASIAQVHCAGPRMAHLHSVLPLAQRGLHVAAASELTPLLANLIEPGDVVLVKGSKGSKVSTCVDALRALSDHAKKTE